MSINTSALAAVLALAVPALRAAAPSSAVAAVTAGVTIAETLVNAAIEGVQLAEQVYDGLKGDQKAQIVLADLKQLAGSLGVDVNGLWAKMQRPLQLVINVVVALHNILGLWPTVKAAAAPVQQA
jgi:hypothetical protein